MKPGAGLPSLECLSFARAGCGGGVSLIVCLSAFVLGCNENPTIVTRATAVSVSPANHLLDAVDDSVQYTALAFDENGIIPAPFLVWRSSDLTVATINANRGTARAVAPGVVEIKATVGSTSGTASLEVYLDPNEGVDFVAGETYFGRRQYIEYVAGSAPVILAAPHGGLLEPDEMSNRPGGQAEPDEGLVDLVRTVAGALNDRLGAHAHVIVSRVRRTKVETDIERDEGAGVNSFAQRAWDEYHEFAERAKGQILSDFGAGLYVSMHGHNHDADRVELGYLLPAADLALPDNDLNAASVVQRSSIRSLVSSTGLSLSALVRGSSSLGAALAATGFAAVPSPSDPNPGAAPYASGGFSISRYGSAEGGTVSAIEVQMQHAGIRDTEQNRIAFANAMAQALEAFLTTHLGYQAPPPAQR